MFCGHGNRAAGAVYLNHNEANRAVRREEEENMKFFRKETGNNANRKIRKSEPQRDVYAAMGGMIVGALYGGRDK